jgi:nicotinamide-nucleotide amidase
MLPHDLLADARDVLSTFEARGWMLATAESCTGGLIASALTAVPGSSAVVERGLVTYTNAAKAELLAVPAQLFDEVGAVSEEVAHAMADGALARAPVQAAVAVTGVAGPGGGTPDKPVGLVYIAVATVDGAREALGYRFDGDRDQVRLDSARQALALLRRTVA